jgi:hypothetical protein
MLKLSEFYFVNEGSLLQLRSCLVNKYQQVYQSKWHALTEKIECNKVMLRIFKKSVFVQITVLNGTYEILRNF